MQKDEYACERRKETPDRSGGIVMADDRDDSAEQCRRPEGDYVAVVRKKQGGCDGDKVKPEQPAFEFMICRIAQPLRHSCHHVLVLEQDGGKGA